MFCERLRKYRESINIQTKREMAALLGVSEQLYAMVERGDRDPSKSFIRKLVIYSHKPTEYWIYGITTVEEINKIDKQMDHTSEAVLELIEKGYITNSDVENFDENIKQIIFAALRVDIGTLLLKKKSNKN